MRSLSNTKSSYSFALNLLGAAASFTIGAALGYAEVKFLEFTEQSATIMGFPVLPLVYASCGLAFWLHDKKKEVAAIAMAAGSVIGFVGGITYSIAQAYFSAEPAT